MSDVTMRLELVAVPVSDVDRAKDFYVRAGFEADHDHVVGHDLRFVQLTPPGSACSIAIGRGLTHMAPGSVTGLQVVVEDIEAAHPKRHGTAKNQHPQIEITGDGNPSGCGRNAQRKAKKKMRPVGETFGEGIEEKDEERDGRELKREGIQLPGSDQKRGNRAERENPGKADRKRSGGESTPRGARIFFVIAEVGDTVDGHSSATSRDHSDDDPEQLTPGGPAVGREARSE